MHIELSWIPGGSVEFLSDLFRIFELTIVAVREREDGSSKHSMNKYGSCQLY